MKAHVFFQESEYLCNKELWNTDVVSIKQFSTGLIFENTKASTIPKTLRAIVRVEQKKQILLARMQT